MLNRRFVGIFVAAAATVVLAGILLDATSGGTARTDTAFHVTLADPRLYVGGVYAESFEIGGGDYTFRFVPNGSSPQTLSISLTGPGFEFAEDYTLKGTLHETGISEYYTWEYEGQTDISIPETQQVTILIHPNGNELGSVSVDIVEN